MPNTMSKWLIRFRGKRSPGPGRNPAIPTRPDPDPAPTAVVVKTTPDGAAVTGTTSGAEDTNKPAGLVEYLELFGERSFPLILIALGLAIAAADDGAEIDHVTGWAMPEYVGTMAFAALLVVLGCLERLVQLRSARPPVVERPRRASWFSRR